MEHVKCRYAIAGKCRHAKLPILEATPERCDPCPYYTGKARGLGDVIATATKAVGIKPCGPCQARREALNKGVPFRRS